MKLIALTVFTILILTTFSFAGAKTVRKEVRNPSGKLLYTTTSTGDRTEVRDPSGKLVETSRRIGDRIEVRSPSGKLLEEIRIKK